MKQILKYAVPFGLGGGLLYWVFKDIDLFSTIQNFKDANYFYVGLALIVAFGAHTSRAFRWNLMLEPLGYKASLSNTTIAVLLGYITNLILPRAGEFARSASLQKSDNIPFEKSFGAVIAERVIDVLVLGLLVLLNLALEFQRVKGLMDEQIGNKFKNSSLLFVILIFSFVFFALFVFFFRKYKIKLLKTPLVKKIWLILHGLVSGFGSVLKLKNPWVFVFHTLFIWSLYFFSTFLLCKAVPIGNNLSFLAVLTILVMGSIAMAAPTLGGIGSYHFLVGKIVVLYGLNSEEGINLATFLHTMHGIIFVVTLGLAAFIWSLIISKPSFKNKKKLIK